MSADYHHYRTPFAIYWLDSASSHRDSIIGIASQRPLRSVAEFLDGSGKYKASPHIGCVKKNILKGPKLFVIQTIVFNFAK